MRRLLIFDCDGTLVDTITDVALSFNAALAANGFPEHPVEAYGGFVGGNLETIVSRLLPEKDRNEENVDRVKTSYRAIYGASEKENTLPFAGIRKMLSSLKEKGYLLAVNTNKAQSLTDPLLEKLFPERPFDCVVGYEETRPSKPDPFGVDLICRKCGCTREDAVYIGDGLSDINTAHNASIPCIFVTWGQGTEEDERDGRIFRVCRSVEELWETLEKTEK